MSKIEKLLEKLDKDVAELEGRAFSKASNDRLEYLTAEICGMHKLARATGQDDTKKALRGLLGRLGTWRRATQADFEEMLRGKKA